MSRKPLPFMRFYVDDYMADTAHLTTLEHGAYDLILWNYWRRQEAPLEERIQRIAKLSDDEFHGMRDTLAEFFQIKSGVWKHKRIELELKRIRDDVLRKKKAGKASGEARQKQAKMNTCSTHDEHLFNTRCNSVEQYIRSNDFPAVSVPFSENQPPKSAKTPPLALGDDTQRIMDDFLDEQWAISAARGYDS